VSLIAVRTFKLVPGRLQNGVEIGLEYVFNLADAVIGPTAYRYYPLFLGLFLFILVSNLLGLIPGLVSPASDLTLTAALAFVVFVYYNFQGFRVHGIGYLRHFTGPDLPLYLLPVRILIAVIELIGTFARPFSMALRLFCNIFSKEMLLGLLAFLLLNFLLGEGALSKGLAVAPLVLRPLILLLGLLVGFIQALVFLILAISYVGGAVVSEEE
jgi:F-type H+-transporting ATPase subunit a